MNGYTFIRLKKGKDFKQRKCQKRECMKERTIVLLKNNKHQSFSNFYQNLKRWEYFLTHSMRKGPALP